MNNERPEPMTLRQRLEASRLESGVFAAPSPGSELAECVVNTERGTIEGYANTWARDSYRSKFMPEAFNRTIGERHTGPMVLGDRSDVNFRLEHRQACGYAVVLAPDSVGLRSVAQLVDFETRGSPGYTALIMAKERVMKGLSIGFDYIWSEVDMLSDKEMRAEGLDPDDTLNWFMPPHDIRDCDLREWSLVSDPANAASRVEVVRSISRLLVPGWRQDPPPPSPSQTMANPNPKGALIVHVHIAGLQPDNLVERAESALEREFTPTPPPLPTVEEEESFDTMCARLAEQI